jgi:hypothetical protein
MVEVYALRWDTPCLYMLELLMLCFFLLCVENVILTLANAKSSTDSYGNLSHTTMLIFCSFALCNYILHLIRFYVNYNKYDI